MFLSWSFLSWFIPLLTVGFPVEWSGRRVSLRIPKYPYCLFFFLLDWSDFLAEVLSGFLVGIGLAARVLGPKQGKKAGVVVSLST